MMTKAALYNSIVAQQDKITRVLGIITTKTIDILENELAEIAGTIKSDHYKNGLKYGHLTIVIQEAEHKTIIGDNAWTYNVPPDVRAYCQITHTNTVNGEPKQQEAKHAVKCNSQADYIAIDATLKQLILHTMGEDVLAPPKGALRKIWIIHHQSNDQAPPQQNSNEDDYPQQDNIPKQGLSVTVGPNHKHLDVLQAHQQLHALAQRAQD
jgi:hypothetical protein